MPHIELTWPDKAEAKALARTAAFPEFPHVASFLAGDRVEGLRVPRTPGRAGAARAVPPGHPRLFPSPPHILPGRHALLEGDNLHALRALHAAGMDYHFIYIDPPYNSGQNFTFRDVQEGAQGSEAAWLSFMYPRLAWGHKVLREEGVLFVSIDDRQHAALALLLDEVFGKANHIATLKWRKKRKPSFLDSHLSSVLEYILVYAKNRSKLPRFRGGEAEETTRPVLNAANSEGTRILRKGTEARCGDGVYKKGTYVNRTLGFQLLDDMKVSKGVLVAPVRVKGRFRVSQEILDATVFVTAQFGLRRHVREEERSHKHVSDDCTDWPTNEDAEAEIRRIFGTRVFEYAKPVGLVQNLLAMCPTRGKEEFRCLDFFAGSGTLAEAALAQNAVDKANRVFTCVQSPEKTSSKNASSVLGTISEITLARANHALRKFGEERPLDLFSSSEGRSLPQL